jgi:hypothetical protein
MSKPKPLKVGFDLDGVLLYNPARLVRPLIKFVKHQLLGKKRVSFFVPKTPLQRFMWDVLHESSLWIAPGTDDIKSLVEQGKIEAYIITGRFKHLKHNTEKWINRLNADSHFKQWHFNQKAEQPHLYKENLIKELDLDVFIDDNWDIVQYLHQQFGPHRKIFWVYNLLDRHIKYEEKHPDLKHAVQGIKQLVIR